MNELFKYYNYLGFHNPFYIIKDNKFLISDSFSELLGKVSKRTLDFTTVVQILSTGYAFGDRTLVKEVKKTPWMAKPTSDSKEWDYFEIPKHNEKDKDENEIAIDLFKLLEDELITYTKGKKSIGLLLTGGMDSRIVASVLNNAIKQNKIFVENIKAFTWGRKDSRDVVYAKQIAEIYNWEWVNLNVDASQVFDNFETVKENGCEFSPIHLHAIPKLLNENLDCVLAGSFGDSVGRAEFSGINIESLKSIDEKIHNFGGLLRSDYRFLSQKETINDLKKYHLLFPREKRYQMFELDLQLHYMRRMLNPCMGVLNKKIPLYQMFSDPKVYGYMWALNPTRRNDLVYKFLLEKYAPELLNIPWARTGLLYPERKGVSDNLRKRHHDYGKLIRKDFLIYIEEIIHRNKSNAELIFNYKSLMMLIKNIKDRPIRNSYSYEEKLIWIATVLEFIEENEIEIELNKAKNNILTPVFNDFLYKSKFFVKKNLYK